MGQSFIRTMGAAAISALALGTLAVGATALSTTQVEAQGQGNGGNGNGNGGGNGKGGDRGGERGGNGKGGDRGAGASGAKGGNGAERSARAGSRGAIASELKGLNAMNASPQAFANAAPESQVGRIREYRDAVIASKELDQAATDAANDLEEARASLSGARNDAVSALGDVEPTDTLSQETIDQAIADLEDGVIGTEALNDVAAALEGTETAGTLDALFDSATTYATAKTTAETAEAAAETAQEDADAALLDASGGRTLSDAALAELNATLGL